MQATGSRSRLWPGRRKTSNPNVHRVLTTDPKELVRTKILDVTEAETANSELFDMIVQTCGDLGIKPAGNSSDPREVVSYRAGVSGQ